jgi:2-dehydro-3-deoxygluconokinase
MTSQIIPILKSPTDLKSFRFASIGECMIEMAPVELAGDYRLGFAGDTFNTAWYLRALRSDVHTQYVTRVGTDEASQNMLRMMNDAGIDTSNIGKSQSRTVGLYLISLKDGERSFSYWREKSAARELGKYPDAIRNSANNADLIYFSGISMAILDDVGRNNLLNTLKDARAAGKTIAFDSNLRPRLWENNAQMTKAVMAAAAVSDIVLPSYDDEVEHFCDLNIEATARRYLDVGAKTVVVKNGGGSVYYSHNGESDHVPVKVANQVVDTTSAGDSFNAAFFASIDKQISLPKMIEKAAQVASQVISRKGALVQIDFDVIAPFMGDL